MRLNRAAVIMWDLSKQPVYRPVGDNTGRHGADQETGHVRRRHERNQEVPTAHEIKLQHRAYQTVLAFLFCYVICTRKINVTAAGKPADVDLINEFMRRSAP